MNSTFFSYKWKRPCENIHKIRQPIRMRRAIELSNIHYIIFIFQHSRLEKKNEFILIKECTHEIFIYLINTTKLYQPTLLLYTSR